MAFEQRVGVAGKSNRVGAVMLWKFRMRDDGGCLVHDALHKPDQFSCGRRDWRPSLAASETIADTLSGASRRHLARTIVGVRVGLMTRHRFGSLFSMFRIDAPCAARRCDGQHSSRGDGAQSALANTNPCHDHAGNSFKSARRRMRSRMS
jgi:hypothetical protein